jgi:hypothetical protein
LSPCSVFFYFKPPPTQSTGALTKPLYTKFYMPNSRDLLAYHGHIQHRESFRTASMMFLFYVLRKHIAFNSSITVFPVLTIQKQVSRRPGKFRLPPCVCHLSHKIKVVWYWSVVQWQNFRTKFRENLSSGSKDETGYTQIECYFPKLMFLEVTHSHRDVAKRSHSFSEVTSYRLAKSYH